MFIYFCSPSNLQCTPFSKPEESVKQEESAEDDEKPKPICEQPEQFPCLKNSEDLSIQNGGSADLCNKETTPILDGPPSVVSLEKKVKKANAAKSSKKSELKSVSSESIKCTTYTCPICKKVFMKRGLFKGHLETHKTDLKFACEICLRV